MVATLHIKGDTDGAVKAAGKAAAAVADVRTKFKEATKEAEKYERAAKKIFEDNLTPMDKYHRKMAELQHLLMQQKISTENYRAEVKKLDDVMSGASEEAARLAQEAKKIAADNISPLEKYNRRMADLDKLLSQQAISTEAYSTEVKKLKDSMSGASEEAARLAALANRISTDNISPLDKYNSKMADLQHLMMHGKISSSAYHAEAAKLKDTLDQTAFDKDAIAIPMSAVQSVMRYGGAILGVSSAWDLVSSAIKGAAEEARKARDFQEDAASAKGALLAIADDEKDYASLIARSDRIAAAGAVPKNQPGAAERMTENLRSADLDEYEATFIELGKKKMVNMPQFIEGISGIRAAYKEGVGTPESMISELFQANAKGKATAGEIAQGTADLGSTAYELKFSHKEIEAAFAGIEEVKPAIVQQRLKSLLQKLLSSKSGKGSLLESVEAIQSSGDTNEDLVRMFGQDDYAIEGYRLVRNNKEKIRTALQSIQKASDGSKLREKLQIGAADRSLVASESSDAASGAADIASQALGDRELRKDAFYKTLNTYDDVVMRRNPTSRALLRAYRGTMSMSEYITGQRGAGGPTSIEYAEWHRKETMRQNALGDTEALDLLRRMGEDMSAIRRIDEELAKPRMKPTVPKPEQ